MHHKEAINRAIRIHHRCAGIHVERDEHHEWGSTLSDRKTSKCRLLVEQQRQKKKKQYGSLTYHTKVLLGTIATIFPDQVINRKQSRGLFQLRLDVVIGS